MRLNMERHIVFLDLETTGTDPLRDKIVQIYAIDETELLRLVRSRITRDLTQDECRRYFDNGKCPPLPTVP